MLTQVLSLMSTETKKLAVMLTLCLCSITDIEHSFFMNIANYI